MSTFLLGESLKNGGLTKINGWITSLRHANSRLTFANLRSNYNEIIQILLDRSLVDTNCLTPESCVTVEGELAPKLKSNKSDPQMSEYELHVKKLILHNQADSPLPLVLHEDQNEDCRLRYRYLDLRRPHLQNNLKFRSQFIHKIRNFFHDIDFLEIETPLLFKSTPEGAKEYLVINEVSKNISHGAYALPQSPQQFKQMLMIGGVSKYFQIAKCFRNEDQRSDRQPEFTQLDLEMGFSNASEVKNIIEKCLKFCLGEERTEFSEISFEEAIARYGSDKPIIHPLEIETVRNDGYIVEESIDILDPGIIDAFHQDKSQGTITKEIKNNRLYVSRYSKISIGTTCLGKMRQIMLKGISDIPKERYKFLWVNDFPLFCFEENEAPKSMHHPFTAPHPQDWNLLSESCLQLYHVRGLHYDLVLNGVEVGGGSVRIHRPKLQEQIFEILKIEKAPFSHLLALVWIDY
jgi:aspartyl-tRNA synthetase